MNKVNNKRIAAGLGFKRLPTSCHCGGSEAWFLPYPEGILICLGCVCHTDLKVVIYEKLSPL